MSAPSSLLSTPNRCISDAVGSSPRSSAKQKIEQITPGPERRFNTGPADTPNSPSNSSADLVEGEYGKPRKKVDFSPWTASSGSVDAKTAIRCLPPSRECQSSKSILKAGRYPQTFQEKASDSVDDLAAMLDSTLQQLAGTDRQMRLDAYSVLRCACKAYDELPDGHVTKEKMQALLEFIRTDLTRKNDGVIEPSETDVLIRALRLLAIIVWNNKLSVNLTDSYRGFILDHSTRVLQEHKMPKAVILHYLHLLSTQSFSAKIMTTVRAVRLLEVLKHLPDHIAGNGVISQRLMVFQRLLEQATGTFRSRPSCWVGAVLAGMTGPIVDTRKKAVNTGYRAASILGPSSTVATALLDSLDTRGEQGDRLSYTICNRMLKMMKHADEGRQVPQIWAVVIALLRGLGRKFLEWPCLPDWLRIIQRCFNCSDREVREEANKAWDKLAMVAHPGSETTPFLTTMLLKPIVAQLHRPSTEKQSKTTRNTAFSSYCSLLYYSLKPTRSPKHHDLAWNEYIVPTLSQTFLSDEQNSDRACRILMALFWRDKVRPWKDSRGLDPGAIEPEELPKVESKWVRSHSRSVLDVFEMLFTSSCWGSSACPDTANIALAWRNFAKALGDTCRKEVILSTESNEAIAHMSKFLVHIGQKGPASIKGAAEDFMCRYHYICKTVLVELGPLTFSEGSISRSKVPSSVPQNPETSHKYIPPVVELIRVLQDLPERCGDGAYSDVIFDLLQVMSKVRSSFQGRLCFLRQCMQSLLPREADQFRHHLTWKAIAKLAYSHLAMPEVAYSAEQLDPEEVAMDIGSILECGVPYQQDECEAWSDLLERSLLPVHGTIRSAAGLIERLTCVLQNWAVEDCGLCTAAVVQGFIQLSQSSPAVLKAENQVQVEIMPLCRKVLGLLNSCLAEMYRLPEFRNEAVLQSFMKATISLFHKCSSEIRLICLAELQESLVAWFEDERGLLTRSSRAGNLKLSHGHSIWSVVIGTLGELHEEIDLRALDRLFASIFGNSNQTVVNQMVQMWNTTYGTNQSLEYGNELAKALARVQTFIDIEVPGLHGALASQANPSPVQYSESLEDDGNSPVRGQATAGLESHKLPLHNFANTGSHHRQHSWARNAASKTMPASQGSKGGRRHNDSQIQFVSTASSPPLGPYGVSQDLRCWQKEVKERQEQDAAFLFPDRLSSSARQSGAARNDGKPSSLSCAASEDDVFATADPVTPNLISRQDLSFEEAARISPTPRSKQQALWLHDTELPSSPLSLAASVEPEEVRANVWTQQAPELEIGVNQPAESPSAHRLMDAEPMGALKTSHLATPAAGDAGIDQASRQALLKYSKDAFPKAAEALDVEEACGENKCVLQESAIAATGFPGGKKAMAAEEAGETGLHELAAPIPLLKPQERVFDIAVTIRDPHKVGGSDIDEEITLETPTWTSNEPEVLTSSYSDDCHFWSASQLSQDLEQAASSASSLCISEPASVSGLVSGKRKGSAVMTPNAKRRKTPGVVLRSDSTSLGSSMPRETYSSQMVYDCIEIDSIPPSQPFNRAASAASQTFALSQPSKRDGVRRRHTQLRERPNLQTAGVSTGRRSLDEAQHGGNEGEATKEQAENVTRSDRLPGPAETLDGRPESPSLTADTSGGWPNGLGTVHASSGSTHTSVATREADKENQSASEEAMQLLEKALSILKGTSMGRSALRKMDDLVFEIRTEAQNAAQRSRPNSLTGTG